MLEKRLKKNLDCVTFYCQFSEYFFYCYHMSSFLAWIFKYHSVSVLCVGRLGFMVCRMFEAPSFYILSPYMTIPTLYGFPKTSTFDNTFLCIAPIKYQIHTQINPCGKVISSSLEDHKRTLLDFLISNTRLRFDTR